MRSTGRVRVSNASGSSEAKDFLYNIAFTYGQTWVGVLGLLTSLLELHGHRYWRYKKHPTDLSISYRMLIRSVSIRRYRPNFTMPCSFLESQCGLSYIVAMPYSMYVRMSFLFERQNAHSSVFFHNKLRGNGQERC